MRMLGFEPFLMEFGKTGRLTMNMSIYRDRYQCACGNTHWFDEYADIVCQGFYKVMVTCPEDSTCVTAIKIKTIFGLVFKGFESLAGTDVRTSREKIMFKNLRLMAK